MIDPVSDPAPRFSTKTMLTALGYAAAAAIAFGSLGYADKNLANAVATNAADDRHDAEMQSARDAEQNRRLDKIEAQQTAQGQLLFDICMAVDCRNKRKNDAS